MTEFWVVCLVIALFTASGLLLRRTEPSPDCCSTRCGDGTDCAGCDLAPSESDHVECT